MSSTVSEHLPLIEDIFISYAHEEVDFAKRLASRISSRGYEAWGDWKIGGAHEWREEIRLALEKINTFIFIVTPNSVDSKECRKEADHAQKYRKRVIPIYYKNIPDSYFKLLHPAIERHQFIDFKSTDNFEESFSTLITAIRTDIDYVRLHSRILQLALEWERGNKDESFLLRGKDLATVRQQLDNNIEKEPKLNPLQYSYILNSGITESRKQRTGLAITLILLLFAVGAALLAGSQYRVAKQETIKALISESEALLANGKRFDALIGGLDATGKYTKSDFGFSELNAEIISTFQNALGFVRQFNLVKSHDVSITDLVASPNGRFLASSDRDGKIIVWELNGSSKTCFSGNQQVTYDLAFSPDSNVLASAGKDGFVRFCYTDGRGLKVLKKEHSAIIWEISFSQDGRFFASSDDKGRIFLWSSDGQFLKELTENASPNAAVTYFSFSPDSKSLASASKNGIVKLWTTEGKVLHRLKAHDGQVKHLAFSPKGDLLATVGEDKKVQLWTSGGRLLKTLIGHQDQVSRVVFSPDGQEIASSGYDKAINLWHKDGRLIKTLDGPDTHRKISDSITFSPDSQFLITASRDKTIKIWKTDGTLVDTLQGHTDQVKHLVVVPQQKLLTLASAGLDKTVRFWRMDHTLVAKLQGHTSTIPRIAYSSDGDYMASVDYDGVLKLWYKGNFLQTLEQKAIAIAFHPQTLRLAVGDMGGSVKLWQPKPKGRIWAAKEVGKLSRDVLQVRFSLDGQLLAAAGTGGEATLYSMTRSQAPVPLIAPQGHKTSTALWDVRFSPNGNLVATAGDDGTIKLWSTNGKYVSDLVGHTEIVLGVNFSGDGSFITAASRDGQVRVWKADGTPLPIRKTDQHTRAVWSVDISPDSQLIASASTDNTVKLWDPSGRLLKTLVGHDAEVRTVAFSPNGQFLASASADNTVKLWHRDGTLFKTLRGSSAPVMVATFSQSGELASADEEGAILQWNSWNWDLQKLVAHSCSYLKDYMVQHPKDQHLCDR